MFFVSVCLLAVPWKPWVLVFVATDVQSCYPFSFCSQIMCVHKNAATTVTNSGCNDINTHCYHPKLEVLTVSALSCRLLSFYLYPIGWMTPKRVARPDHIRNASGKRGQEIMIGAGLHARIVKPV